MKKQNSIIPAHPPEGKINIRKFQERDKEQVQSLIEDCLIEIFGEIDYKSYIQDPELKQNYLQFYVAEEDNKIVGTIAIKKKEEIYKLKRMYVHKDYRGTGLAQRLYRQIETFVIKEGATEINLSTFEKMRAAQKFYEKCGFRKIGEDKTIGGVFFKNN